MKSITLLKKHFAESKNCIGHQHILMHFQNGIFQLQVHLRLHGILLNRNHAPCLLSQLLKCPVWKFHRRCRTFLRPIRTVWLRFLPQLFRHNLEPLLLLFYHLPILFKEFMAVDGTFFILICIG